MAISASSIASSSTLNELRTQFNNLVTDVTAIEGGSISYTTLNTTTTNATTLNVKEDGTIVFEGATDDGFETTLTVVDPTADRTITFPNETGTVHTTGGTTTHTNIIIGDGGNIGSASDTNAIGISSGGVVSVTATTANTSASDGALTVAGGLGVAADVSIGDDLRLISDSSVLSFGADSDTTLTHTDGSGLTLNSTNKLMFNDASQFIQGASATVLDIAATDEIELTATLIDIVGRAEVSGNLSVGGNLDVTGTLDLSDSNFTNVGSLQLDSIAGDGDTDSSITFSGSDVITIATGGSTAATFNASQVTTLSGNLIIPDAGNIGSASDTDAIAIGSDGDITLTQDLELQHDGAILSFGANDEIALTHVHDTGLLLTDSGGTPTLQLHDSAESVSSDGSKLILTSNSVAFNLPTADGTAGQVLKTDGSGTLSFVTASANTPTSADGQALGSASLEWSDLFLADGGTIQLGNDQDVTITHIADTGVRMNSSSKIQFTDANESIHSDGTNLILTSGGTTFKVPTSDGSNGQALATNGSGTLSFINVSSAADDLTAGDAAINLTTTSGNITIDAQANDSDVIIKGTDATADITMATFDGSDAGTLILNHDLELGTDAALIKFGADNEITLTHVADTGLLLEDSGGSPTLQFHNSSEAVSSDGSKLILTSNGVAFSLPTADGSNGQALVTNASGVLSFADAGSSVAFNNFEYTATAAQTSFSGNDDNSNSLAYTAGVNTVQVLVNGVMLDSSDYTATNGTAVVLSAAAAANDMIKVVAVQSTSVTSADLDGAEFVLDADGDTTIHADTDDQIDIKIAGADDFRFTANNFNVLSGSTLTIDSGATITNSGTSSGFGLSTGKAIVLSMIFG
jgi:hypothetical protein